MQREGVKNAKHVADVIYARSLLCCPDFDGAVAHVWAVDDLAGVAQRQRSQADLRRVTVPVLLRHP